MTNPLNYMDDRSQVAPSEQELRAFVGPNADYYLRRWAGILHGAPDTRMNWAAFFLTGLWLAYRRMYRVSLILLGAALVETLAEEMIFVVILGQPEPPRAIYRLVTLAVAIICGMWGNRWYLAHARRVIAQVRNEYPDETRRLEVLSTRGGRSVLASLLFIVVAVILMFAVGILVEVLYGIMA